MFKAEYCVVQVLVFLFFFLFFFGMKQRGQILCWVPLECSYHLSRGLAVEKSQLWDRELLFSFFIIIIDIIIAIVVLINIDIIPLSCI